jgi:hypothetical protein
VILITPYLVKPSRDRVATTPLDRPVPPPPPGLKADAARRSSGLIIK